MESVLRRVVTAGTLLALAGALVLVTPSVANACSCALRTLEESVPEASVVFIGREVDRLENPVPERDGAYVPPVLVVFEVDEWLSGGEAPLEITVGTGRGSGDCGVGSMAGRGQFGVYAFGEPGNLSISSCGGVADPDELRAVVLGLPAATTGVPGFAVAQSLGDSRIAVLDDAGTVVGYGKGDGRVDAIAACSGGEAIVEAVVPDLAHELSGIQSLEVRQLDSLEIVSSRNISLSAPRLARGGNSIWWLRDLECHDGAGEVVSYLLPRAEWNALAGAELHADGAEFHWWDGSGLRVVAVGDARAVAVAPELDLLMTVSGPDGETVSAFSLLAGKLLWSMRLADGDVAWDVAYSADLELFSVLANDRALEPENRYFAAVDRAVLIDPQGTAVAVHEFGERRVAMALEPVPGGFVAATGWEGQPGAHVVIVDGSGQAVAEEAIPADTFLGSAAWGDLVPLVVSGGRAVTGGSGVGEVGGIADPRWVVALRDGAVTIAADSLGQSTTTTLGPDAGSTVPTQSEQPTGEESQLGQAEPVAGVEQPGGSLPLVWLAGIALALLTAVGVAVLVRRRRTYLEGWSTSRQRPTDRDT